MTTPVRAPVGARCSRCSGYVYRDTEDVHDYGEPDLVCIACGARQYARPPAPITRDHSTPVRVTKAQRSRPHGWEARLAMHEQVRALRAQGLKPLAIAKALGVPTRTVHRHTSECSCESQQVRI